MELSIIIPAFNEEKNIGRCLKSLLNQNNKNFEIIVVDNSSKDRTREIAKKYCSNVVVEKKKGYHNAVKKGTAIAKGNLLAVCDADSIYPKDWTEKIFYTFKTNRKIVACYGSVKFFDGNKYTRKFYEKIFLLFMKIMKKKGIHVCNGFNFVFKKSAYKKSKGYNPKIYDKAGVDIELGIRLGKLGKILFIKDMVAKTSLRRVEEQGLAKLIIKNTKMYASFIRKKDVKESYEEYNIRK